jgi:translation initiation factor 5B
VKVSPDAEAEAENRGVKIFQQKVIYHLIDDFSHWLQSERDRVALEQFDLLVKPGKIRIIPGYVFRKAKPAIVGVEIIAGRISPKVSLVKKDGESVGTVMQVQHQGKPVSEAVANTQVAVSLDKAIVGRHIKEKDVLFVQVPETHAKALLTKFSDRLTSEELESLNEYVEAMRKKTNPFWAA